MEVIGPWPSRLYLVVLFFLFWAQTGLAYPSAEPTQPGTAEIYQLTQAQERGQHLGLHRLFGVHLSNLHPNSMDLRQGVELHTISPDDIAIFAGSGDDRPFTLVTLIHDGDLVHDLTTGLDHEDLYIHLLGDHYPNGAHVPTLPKVTTR